MNDYIEEYKGIRAIYPPEDKVIVGACWSCDGDVRMDRGFVDMQRRSYICVRCATSGINSTILSRLIGYSQEKNLKTTGKFCRF